MFDNILLELEQKTLLMTLVEAYRNVPRDQRQRFLVIETDGSTQAIVSHPGLQAPEFRAYKGDFEILGRYGLLSVAYNSHGILTADIMPVAFRYYEYLRREGGQPLERIQSNVRQFLAFDDFQRKYQIAYQKWLQAEALLWGDDSGSQLTAIGHLCREAMQEFATSLIKHYAPPVFDTDKAHTKNRLSSVLALRAEQLGTTVKPFLDAVIGYWDALNLLVQRQEHGGQKEGSSLIWEDGRRVVFQTAIVMYEIDKTLGLTH